MANNYNNCGEVFGKNLIFFLIFQPSFLKNYLLYKKNSVVSQKLYMIQKKIGTFLFSITFEIFRSKTKFSKVF